MRARGAKQRKWFVAKHDRSLVDRSAAGYNMQMDELIFEVTQEGDGGYVAECLTEPIFTQADSWDELRSQIQDAVRGYFFDVRVTLGSADVAAPPPLSRGVRIFIAVTRSPDSSS